MEAYKSLQMIRENSIELMKKNWMYWRFWWRDNGQLVSKYVILENVFKL